MLLSFYFYFYFTRCTAGPVNTTNTHIDQWAVLGLRTLAVAARELSRDQLDTFSRDLGLAQQDLEDRERKVQAVYDEVERDYTLLGATAVEDKLQDGVKETLINLGLAGISVWILTGDKKETAINIRSEGGPGP